MAKHVCKPIDKSYKIALLSEGKFIELVILYCKVGRAIGMSNSLSAYVLTKDMYEQRDFRAWGLVQSGSTIRGIITGYSLGNNTYYFSCLYCEVASKLKGFMKDVESQIKELGYTSWEADSNHSNMSSILTKMECFKKSARHRKEL